MLATTLVHGAAAQDAAGGDSAAPIAVESRLAGDKTRTRFVADLSESVDMAVFALADPYRIIVDLPEIDFRLSPETGREGRGLVDAFRFGRFAPGKSRIVLDANEPVKIDRAFVLDPVDDQPARLVVDLVRTDRDSFLRSAALERAKSARRDAQDDSRTAQVAPRRDKDKPLVVLDPGHGGIDPGAISRGGTTEKTIVLEFAKMARDLLEKQGRFEVLLTREDDRFLQLAERVEIARKRDAALFVSIHADSIDAPEVRGATVYTRSERASDRHAAAVAAKENASDAVAGISLSGEDDEVNDILFDLALRETKNFSIMFAKGLIEDLRSAARMNKNPHRFAQFRVLKAPDVPSVLLELGYLSSPHDEKLLTSGEWRQRTGEAFVKAVETFFARKTAHGAY